jgi:hypothetical protein
MPAMPHIVRPLGALRSGVASETSSWRVDYNFVHDIEPAWSQDFLPLFRIDDYAARVSRVSMYLAPMRALPL